MLLGCLYLGFQGISLFNFLCGVKWQRFAGCCGGRLYSGYRGISKINFICGIRWQTLVPSPAPCRIKKFYYTIINCGRAFFGFFNFLFFLGFIIFPP